jgi:DNA repair exonuclease SbcCD ATPase subunit
MFEIFTTNINTKCQNCINHSNNINQFYCNNNLNYQNVKEQYEYLTNLQNEKEQIYNYHMIKQYDHLKKYLDILELMMNDIIIQLESYEANNLNIIKDNLLEIINKLNNSNLLYQIEAFEQSKNDEYIMLLNELELYNEYNKKLEDYNNYKYNLEIYKKIDENKKIIIEFNDKEIIQETISNLILNEKNEQKYYTLCDNIENLTEKINICKNKHLENIKQYNSLNEKEKKYMDLINDNLKLEKEQIVLLKIIELTGIEGIPRKIINIKLSYVENEINKLLLPFLNKKMVIKAETNENTKSKKKNIDIHVFFDDNKNKTNLLGGFESFLISLAFKITLSNFFNVQYCGMLIIDEGVSVLDKDNVDKFDIIADFVRQYYNNIILISHIPSFNDYIDTFIQIEKNKDKTSKIFF